MNLLAFSVVYVIGMAEVLAPTFSTMMDGKVDNDPRDTCAVSALSLFCNQQKNGEHFSYDSLLKSFPIPGPLGHSMKDIIDVARQHHLELDGVLIENEIKKIDQPMIAFVKNEIHGHFIVVFPVSTDGTIVSVVDGKDFPSIMDFSSLKYRKGWTGRVLIANRINHFYKNVFFYILLVLGIMLFASVSMRYWQRSISLHRIQIFLLGRLRLRRKSS